MDTSKVAPSVICKNEASEKSPPDAPLFHGTHEHVVSDKSETHEQVAANVDEPPETPKKRYRPRSAPQSVAGFPAQVRIAAEYICKNYTVDEAAAGMGISVNTVRNYLARARKLTGTHNVHQLKVWCQRRGQVRHPREPAILETVAARTPKGHFVDVFVYSAIELIEKHWPEQIQQAARRIRARRERRDTGVRAYAPVSTQARQTVESAQEKPARRLNPRVPDAYRPPKSQADRKWQAEWWAKNHPDGEPI